MRNRREQERTDAGKEGCRKLRKGRLKREEKERTEAGKERIQERKSRQTANRVTHHPPPPHHTVNPHKLFIPYNKLMYFLYFWYIWYF